MTTQADTFSLKWQWLGLELSLETQPCPGARLLGSLLNLEDDAFRLETFVLVLEVPDVLLEGNSASKQHSLSPLLLTVRVTLHFLFSGFNPVSLVGFDDVI